MASDGSLMAFRCCLWNLAIVSLAFSRLSAGSHSSSDGKEEVFEVSEILDSGIVRGKLHYLVCWKDYSPSEDE